MERNLGETVRHDQEIPQRQQFGYLGSIINHDGEIGRISIIEYN